MSNDITLDLIIKADEVIDQHAEFEFYNNERFQIEEDTDYGVPRGILEQRLVARGWYLSKIERWGRTDQSTDQTQWYRTWVWWRKAMA